MMNAECLIRWLMVPPSILPTLSAVSTPEVLRHHNFAAHQNTAAHRGQLKPDVGCFMMAPQLCGHCRPVHLSKIRMFRALKLIELKFTLPQTFLLYTPNSNLIWSLDGNSVWNCFILFQFIEVHASDRFTLQGRPSWLGCFLCFGLIYWQIHIRPFPKHTLTHTHTHHHNRTQFCTHKTDQQKKNPHPKSRSTCTPEGYNYL